MVCLELPFVTNVCGYERVLTVTQIHSNLSSKQHTITKNMNKKNMVTICCASTSRNDTTNTGLQHIAQHTPVNNLVATQDGHTSNIGQNTQNLHISLSSQTLVCRVTHQKEAVEMKPH